MIRKRDRFYAESINQEIEILDILPGNRLKCRFTRDNHTDEGDVDAKKILPSLLNPDLYKKL